jgi:hypothetical protein
MLAGTGLLPMAASPSYEEVLAVRSPWSLAIFAKHLGVGLMAALAAYPTWGIRPQITRLAILRAKGVQVDAIPLEPRQAILARANLLLGLAVLALTALARTI